MAPQWRRGGACVGRVLRSRRHRMRRWVWLWISKRHAKRMWRWNSSRRVLIVDVTLRVHRVAEPRLVWARARRHRMRMSNYRELRRTLRRHSLVDKGSSWYSTHGNGSLRQMLDRRVARLRNRRGGARGTGSWGLSLFLFGGCLERRFR